LTTVVSSRFMIVAARIAKRPSQRRGRAGAATAAGGAMEIGSRTTVLTATSEAERNELFRL
jgi:hypothetical protein